MASEVKKIIVFFLIILFSGALSALSIKKALNKNEAVICLHGLRRTKNSMGKIEKRLQKNGYTVFNRSYPSHKKTVEALSIEFLSPLIDIISKENFDKIHFVTHSLGGILVRQYLQNNRLPEGSRIVMLSPPNNGSEVTDLLKDWKLYQLFNGPAGLQLGTDSLSIVKKLNPVKEDIGIIAGNLTLEPWFSIFIAGDDDGKVSTQSAKLTEMKDFLIVHEGHTFIAQDNQTIEQILFFLQNGVFQHFPEKK